MSTSSVQGPMSARQIEMQQRNKQAGREPVTGQNILKKTVRLINSAAGAPLNKNFIDSANLDSLMLAIMSERAELLEEMLREQVQEVRSKNNKLKDANSIMGKARDNKKGAKEDKKTPMSDKVKEFFEKNNVPWSSKDLETNDQGSLLLNSGQWDLAIENMKGWSESLTSSSQLDMTKLQSTSGKFNQTFEMMSQFVAKYYRSGDSIIKNI